MYLNKPWAGWKEINLKHAWFVKIQTLVFLSFFLSYLSSADLLFSTNSLDDWSSFPTFTLVIPADEEKLINNQCEEDSHD